MIWISLKGTTVKWGRLETAPALIIYINYSYVGVCFSLNITSNLNHCFLYLSLIISIRKHLFNTNFSTLKNSRSYTRSVPFHFIFLNRLINNKMSIISENTTRTCKIAVSGIQLRSNVFHMISCNGVRLPDNLNNCTDFDSTYRKY